MNDILILINLLLMVKNDLQKGIVPDILQINLLGLFLISKFDFKQLITCIVLYYIFKFFEEKWHLYIGGADVKLIIIFTYYLGSLIINLLFIASTLGLIEIIIIKTKNLKFIPHLVISYYLVVVLWL